MPKPITAGYTSSVPDVGPRKPDGRLVPRRGYERLKPARPTSSPQSVPQSVRPSLRVLKPFQTDERAISFGPDQRAAPGLAAVSSKPKRGLEPMTCRLLGGCSVVISPLGPNTQDAGIPGPPSPTFPRVHNYFTSPA
jgi:hypothetical protein